MSYLLDTHAFLWFINDDPSLSTSAKPLIEDPENTIYLSVASVWEMAIKLSLGKLEMPSSSPISLMTNCARTRLLCWTSRRHTQVL